MDPAHGGTDGGAAREGDIGGRRGRFDLERVDVFGVALDAVAILDHGQPRGQKIYGRRKCIPERVFAQMALICGCRKLRKLWAARRADRLG